MITEKDYVWFICDLVILSTLGFALGLIVDVIFHNPNSEEPFWKTIFLLIMQLFAIGLIIYIVTYYYEIIFARNPDKYSGITMFIFIFLITQFQIYYRVEIVYGAIVGSNKIDKAG